MGLGTALNTALSGLRVSQEAMSVLSSNIANANTENYSRRIVEQASVVSAGSGVGVDIKAIGRKVDDFLAKGLREQASTVGRDSVINEYLSRLQITYGQPGSDNNLNATVDAFFASAQNLATNPHLMSLKLDVVNKANNVAEKIGDIADTIYNLRYEADQELAKSFKQINSKVEKLHNLNISLGTAIDGSSEKTSVQEEIEFTLRELAEYIDISTFTDQSGKISVNIVGKASILDDKRYEIEYSPASSADVFKNESALDDVIVKSVLFDGSLAPRGTEIVSVGNKDTAISLVNSGKIKGLIELRDKELPKLLAQLDNLADNITNSVNAIHNDGTAFPPAKTYTATFGAPVSALRNWSGTLSIGVTDALGNPLNEDVASSSVTPKPTKWPLDIDLSTLNAGSGSGKVDLKTVVREINSYYGPQGNRAEIGGLYDMRIAAVSDTIAAGSNFTFDFDLTNRGSKALNFEVMAVEVRQNIAGYPAGGALVSALPPTYNIDKEEKERTSTSNAAHQITVSLNAGITSYVVRAQVKIDGGTAQWVDYVVNPANNMRNRRAEATQLVTGSSAIISGSSNGYLRASIVDKNGQALTDLYGNELVPGNLEEGFLKITGIGDNRITIQSGKTVDGGLSTDSSDIPTNKSFSAYFGMNNLFVDNGKVEGAAYKMKIRDDIAKDPNLLSIGELSKITNSTTAGGTYYTYGVGAGSNQTASKIANLSIANISFKSAGGLPNLSGSLGGYASNIIGYSASRATLMQNNAKQSQAISDGYKERLQQGSGVNLDEELANTVIYQNAYSASARVITVTKELFDTLMQSVS